ncbi:hypothetical protein [Dactylosporangium sp. CS-033363]|uniref:hypothetical protein n=1 Tax=Dactylosporangium sp. CS-033363 TaxID=3239935 RepID=UPI003D8D466E
MGKRSTSTEKRLRWFDDGAPMLRLVANRLGIGDWLPIHEEYYACPCCLMAYNRAAVFAGVLTEEHVPAAVVGGRGLLLTCKNCNSNAGRDFDAHAGTRLQADDFARGKVTDRTLPATSYVDGIPLRGTVRMTRDGIQMFGVPKQNDPKTMAAHFAALDAYAQSGITPNHSFTVHTRYDEKRARYSWIRSAYLAAFAALGWSYIFQDVMEPYREQLKQPDTQLVPTYIGNDRSASSSLRRILLVTEPDDLRCVAVNLGTHTIFLPGIPPWRPQTCDELVQAFSRYRGDDERLNGEISGKEVSWPRWPTYLLDRPPAPNHPEHPMNSDRCFPR